MKDCFRCGVSGDKARLFDAISQKGIVKICEKCSSNEDIPIIRKPVSFQFKESKEGQTVYERLSRMSGVDSGNKEKGFNIKKQETSLRELVDKNFESKIKKEAKPRHDLIDNFHWIIMRVRRAKKITPKQVAEAIAEPEAAIKMAEKGILPEDYKLVNKLENYFGINLRKEKTKVSNLDVNIEKEEIVKQGQPQLGFDPITTKTLTISDLQEMKEKKEAEILEGKENYVFNEDFDLENSEEKPEFIEKQDKNDLSQDEINDLIFGGKRDDKK